MDTPAVWIHLQKLISICTEFYCNHSLRININKTKVMIVLPDRLKDIRVPNFVVDGSVLKIVKEEKCLGVIIRNNGDDGTAIDKEIRSLYSRGNMICRKFKSCCDEVKRQLYISFCSSFYCCSLWSSYSVSSLRSLNVAHNNVFRNLFRLPRIISISSCFVERNVPCFKIIRRKLVFSMYRRILESKNQLIMALINQGFVTNSSMFNEWLHVLYFKEKVCRIYFFIKVAFFFLLVCESEGG